MLSGFPGIGPIAPYGAFRAVGMMWGGRLSIPGRETGTERVLS